MSRQLTGTLLLPNGTALATTTLQFVAERNEPASIVKAVDVTTTTNGSGVYDVTLEPGIYTVVLTYSNRPVKLGSITVTTGSATTLNALFGESTPTGATVGELMDYLNAAYGSAADFQQDVTDTASNAAAAQAGAATATTKAAEAAASADSAAAVVTGGTATLTPEAGKIPLADGEGHVDLEWLDWSKIRLAKLQNPLVSLFNKNEIATKLAGTLTATRATTATYIDRYGVLKSAAINEMREEKEGWLIEGASTNLLLYSEDFSNAEWPKTRSTVTANTVTAPDGTLTADRLVEDSTASATHQIQSGAVAGSVANVNNTVSVFAKAGERSRLRLVVADTGDYTSVYRATFDLLSGTMTSSDAAGAGALTGVSIEALADGWYRCSLSGVANSGSGSAVDAVFYLDGGSGVSYTGDGSSGLYLWGAQLEALPFATSYIPATSAAATRADDKVSALFALNMPSADSDFSVVASVKAPASDTVKNICRMRFNTDADTATADFRRMHISGKGTPTLYGQNGVTQAANRVSAAIPVEAVGTRASVAHVANKSADFHGIYVNGAVLDTDVFPVPTDDYKKATSGVVAFGGLEALNAEFLFGHLSNFRIYDFALTPQEVALLAGE